MKEGGDELGTGNQGKRNQCGVWGKSRNLLISSAANVVSGTALICVRKKEKKTKTVVGRKRFIDYS